MSGSVLRNVSYGLRLRRLPPQEVRDRAREALDAMGLTGMETRPASSLSSGQRKRLGIARALAMDPMVLLLDEPDGNVDMESVRIIEGAIRRGKARGMTAIVSTHDAGFAYRQADHLLRLDEGQLAPSAANVLRGRVSARDEDFCHFDAAGVPILCPTREGDFEVAVIFLGDVILSRELVWTSARNRLRGTVAEIHAQGPLYRVSVDCGIRIEALVTGAALRELAIEPGRSVHVFFKASAVALYERHRHDFLRRRRECRTRPSPTGRNGKSSLSQALGRALPDLVRSPLDSPPFDKAAMDGYAVLSTDASGSFRVVEVRPGMPTLFAEREGKSVFGLPGNPVSTFVIFEVLVKPFLLATMGVPEGRCLARGVLAARRRKRSLP